MIINKEGAEEMSVDKQIPVLNLLCACACLQNVKIINKEGVEEMSDEKRGIYIRSGIVVVTKGECECVFYCA